MKKRIVSIIAISTLCFSFEPAPDFMHFTEIKANDSVLLKKTIELLSEINDERHVLLIPKSDSLQLITFNNYYCGGKPEIYRYEFTDSITQEKIIFTQKDILIGWERPTGNYMLTGQHIFVKPGCAWNSTSLKPDVTYYWNYVCKWQSAKEDPYNYSLGKIRFQCDK